MSQMFYFMLSYYSIKVTGMSLNRNDQAIWRLFIIIDIFNIHNSIHSPNKFSDITKCLVTVYGEKVN